MSVLKALALAEGVLPTAAVNNARILREVEPHGQRQEITVDIKSIVAGKAPDRALLPDDVLLIPTSVAKTIAARMLEAGVQMATGLVIWRQY
jgi:protein involved in polysaccharide export with SLBB domain